MLLRIDQFRGLSPKTSPALLPPSGAQVASQARLTTGSLVPINTPKLVSSQTAASALSLYMLGPQGAQIPLTWATDVDVAASPITDSEYKVYYSGDGEPKKTNLTLATGGGSMPANWYYMGTPAPTAAPTLASTTGSVPAGTYAYVYTYVTTFGSTLTEESAPSPAATITLGATGGVTITNLNNPASTANRNYTHKRIYRTTGAAYQMVAQIAFATTSFTDNLSATAIAGDSLITSGWIPPPTDLKGLCSLPNQTMAGFRENEVWFCEPGYPHAWPVKYMQTVGAEIVGIKPYGNSLVVATIEYPEVGSGLHPESFTFRKLPLLEPCVSKRSMAAMADGVLYASQNGLVSVGDNGYGVASAPFISRESFRKFAPETFRSCVFEGRYYGFYDYGGVSAGALVFAREEETPVSTVGVSTNAVTIDMYTARMLFINNVDNFLYEYDPLDTVPYTYNWKSKLFKFQVPVSFGCVRLMTSAANLDPDLFAEQLAQTNADIQAANAVLLAAGTVQSELNMRELNFLDFNGSMLTPPAEDVPATVGLTIWADGEQKYSRNVPLNTVLRLPSGFMATDWEVAVSGQREVFTVELATSPREFTGG